MGMIDCYLPDDLASTAESFASSYHVKGKNCVQFILQDNYDFIADLHSRKTSDGRPKIRDFTFDQIQKCILCGTTDLGYTIYECPVCEKVNFIPNRCHSRFCSSCAVQKAKATAAEISSVALDCKHRHIVLTIPEELRYLFLAHRELLNILMIAGRNTIYDIVNDAKFRKAKRKGLRQKKRKPKNHKSLYSYKDDDVKVMPGFITTLHTFGRDLKWNPHLHILCSEKGYDCRKDRMKSIYFSYKKIRKTWQYNVLSLLSRTDLLRSNAKFRRLKDMLYRRNSNGFYIYAPDTFADLDDDDMDDDDYQKLSDNIKGVVGYITRYTSRPVIADSRIDDYDEEAKTVTWHYTGHDDGERHDVTQPVQVFILKLIRHCPDKNFKMTRRYGYYANAYSGKLDHIYEIYGKQIKRNLKGKKQRKKAIDHAKRKCKYRASMILSFNRDPIKCTCGAIMVPTFNYDPYERGKKNELLRRIERDSDIKENNELYRESRWRK